MNSTFQTSSPRRLSVILAIKPRVTDRLGITLPAVGPVGRKALTERCVSSVLKELNALFDPIGTELIVVDGGSTERIGDHLRTVFPHEIASERLRVIDAETSLDIAELRNDGARRSNGSWLTFIEEISTWEVGHLTRVEPHFSGNDLILGYRGTTIPDHGDWLQAVLTGAVNSASWVTSASFIRRSLFEELNGFPEARYGMRSAFLLWLKAWIRLREKKQLSRFVALPSTTVREETPAELNPTLAEGREVLSLVASLGILPRRLWPQTLKRVVSFLLNR